MPRIKEYTSRVETPGPVNVRQATGEDFGSQAFKGAEALGKGVQEISDVFEKQQQRSDISDTSAKLAELHANSTNKLAEKLRTADPNDPSYETIVDDFMKEYDDAAGKIKEGIKTGAGQDYYREANAKQKAHFLQSAFAGKSELAGIKARQDYTSVINNLSSSLVNDPSGLQVAQEMHADSLKNLVELGTLPREAALKLETQGKSELTKSAVRGWINLNPEYAKEQLKKGRWDKDVDGDLKVQLMGESDAAIRGKEIEAERIVKKQKEILTQQQTITQNDFLGKLDKGELTSKEVLNSNLDPIGSGSKEQFLKLIDTRNKEAGDRTDPSTFRDLFERIHLPDGDPRKIVDENALNQYVIGQKLSFEDMNRLRGEVQGKKTTDGENTSNMKKQLEAFARSQLVKENPMLGLRDPIGEQNYLSFMALYYDEYRKLKKEGKTDLQLLNPASPDYLGKLVNNFRKSPQQIIRDQVGFMQSGPQPTPSGEPIAAPAQVAPTLPLEKARKPGESIEQWRKRTKGQ